MGDEAMGGSKGAAALTWGAAADANSGSLKFAREIAKVAAERLHLPENRTTWARDHLDVYDIMMTLGFSYAAYKPSEEARKEAPSEFELESRHAAIGFKKTQESALEEEELEKEHAEGDLPIWRCFRARS